MNSPESFEFPFHFNLVHETIHIVGTYNGSEYTKIFIEVHFIGLKIGLSLKNFENSIKNEGFRGVNWRSLASESFIHWYISQMN